MKKLFYLFSLAVALAGVFTSCQKVIDIDVNTSASQLVIEGNITNIRETQFIKISRSVAYSASNVYPAVSGATVQVSDNVGNTYRFNETAAGSGLYSFGPLRGVSGRTYTLRATIDGQVYTATSVLPNPVRTDSLTLSKITFGSNSRNIVSVNFNDPKNVANQYRFIQYINGKQVNRIYVIDDRLTDGNRIKQDLYFDDDDFETDKLETGDVARVEIQCIDKPVFTYFFTFRQKSRGGPGGGTTPGNPPSNINNGALGYFSAHTYQTIEIKIP